MPDAMMGDFPSFDPLGWVGGFLYCFLWRWVVGFYRFTFNLFGREGAYALDAVAFQGVYMAP